MPKITYRSHGGAVRMVEAAAGSTVMETAIRNGVEGIDADCGGACACATCHVYVEEEWLAKLGPRSEMEASMLEFAEDVRANSRLGCQITMTEELDGLMVETPVSQH